MLRKFQGVIGGITFPAIPNSTLKTALDLLVDNNFSSVIGTAVKFTFANQDFEVATAGANEIPDGIVTAVYKSSGTYTLSVHTTKYTGTQEISLTGLALGDKVEAGAAGIWALDNTNGTYRVIAYDSPVAIIVTAKPDAIVALTDNTAGTANNTLEALTSGITYSTDVAAIRNNFADLAAKVNELRAALQRLQ